MEATSHAERPPAEQAWLTYGVHGKDIASVLADLRREIPTALLPTLLTATLGPHAPVPHANLVGARAAIGSGAVRATPAPPGYVRVGPRCPLGVRSAARRG